MRLNPHAACDSPLHRPPPSLARLLLFARDPLFSNVSKLSVNNILTLPVGIFDKLVKLSKLCVASGACLSPSISPLTVLSLSSLLLLIFRDLSYNELVELNASVFEKLTALSNLCVSLCANLPPAPPLV